MSGEAQLILAIVGVFVGGGFATLLGVLTNALLKTQRQQGEQQAEWRAIISSKDAQILTLQARDERQAARIENLEMRIIEVERRASRAENRADEAEARVAELEKKVDH